MADDNRNREFMQRDTSRPAIHIIIDNCKARNVQNTQPVLYEEGTPPEGNRL